jgi:hypothetical protein
MSLCEYIEARCIPEPNSGCWLWLLSIGTHGYGQASMPGARVTTAHRVSYIAFKGAIPDGLLVQHSCDNKLCVNPDHLSLGTDKSNSDDKHRKGRATLESRVFTPRADRLLTDAQADDVRNSNEPYIVVARRLGIDSSIVRSIRLGRTYKPHHRPLDPHIELGRRVVIDLATAEKALKTG